MLPLNRSFTGAATRSPKGDTRHLGPVCNGMCRMRKQRALQPTGLCLHAQGYTCRGASSTWEHQSPPSTSPGQVYKVTRLTGGPGGPGGPFGPNRPRGPCKRKEQGLFTLGQESPLWPCLVANPAAPFLPEPLSPHRGPHLSGRRGQHTILTCLTSSPHPSLHLGSGKQRQEPRINQWLRQEIEGHPQSKGSLSSQGGSFTLAQGRCTQKLSPQRPQRRSAA